VALDRQAIVRRDFPTQRRGYDPAAVDAHLDELAGEVEALQRRAAAPPSVSEQAAGQVKSIIAAAERGAQEIRESARAEAREHVARATEAADRLRARIEELVQASGELLTGAERLRDELTALRAEVEEVGEAAPAAPPPAAVEHAAAAEPAAAADPAAPGPPPAGAAQPPPAAVAQPAAANGDAAAARIVALDMALSGKPREETDRYLAEHYDVPDRAALLDDVYAAARA
jgi:DivIVA domain-containing protein